MSTKVSKQEKLYADAVVLGVSKNAALAASGLMSPPDKAVIKAEIKRVREDYSRRLGFTREDVINGLHLAINVATTAGEMIAGWREIGKIIGAYEPQKVVLEVRNTADIEALPTAELLRLANFNGATFEGEYDQDEDNGDE